MAEEQTQAADAGMTVLAPDALALVERTHLRRGKHETSADGMCAMELVSFLAGEKFSDHPGCVCPVIGAFVRSWNDALPDGERDAILKPFLSRLIGTRGGDALAERRALLAGDWLVRVHTPAWLRRAKLDASADALAALPEITSLALVPAIRGPIEAAQRAAAAASDTASDTAWHAVGAGIAAQDAAWAAVCSTAWITASDAARAAANATANAVLEETRLALHVSATELLGRMIDAREAFQ